MTTNWTVRVVVTTDWDGRQRPIYLIAPLQDAYRIVHNEDNEIIYIISTSWKEVPITQWEARPVLDD